MSGLQSPRSLVPLVETSPAKSMQDVRWRAGSCRRSAGKVVLARDFREERSEVSRTQCSSSGCVADLEAETEWHRSLDSSTDAESDRPDPCQIWHFPASASDIVPQESKMYYVS